VTYLSPIVAQMTVLILKIDRPNYCILKSPSRARGAQRLPSVLKADGRTPTREIKSETRSNGRGLRRIGNVL